MAAINTLVLILTLLLAPQGTGDSAKASGAVINPATKAPIDAVQVQFKSGTGSARSVVTSRDGKFAIANLPAGSYEVTVSRASFVAPQGPRRLTLKPGDDLKNLQLELIPGSAISGRLVDQNGRPLSPAIVLALPIEYMNGQRVLFPGGLMSRILYSPLEHDQGSDFTAGPVQARADEKGEYRLFGLAPGEYVLAIWQKSGDKPTLDLPPIYYPGVWDPAAAIPLRVRANSNASGINISVPPVPGHVARFKVSLPTAAPYNCALPGSTNLPVNRSFILVQHSALYDVVHFSATRLPGREDDIGNDNSNAGRFHSIGENEWETSKLAPGFYEIYHSFCISAGLALASRLPFQIKNEDVDAGSITLSPNVTLRGHVRNVPGSSTPLSQVVLRMRPTDWRGLHPGMAPNPTPAQRLPVAVDGTFAFEHRWNASTVFGSVAPGHYQIDVGGLPPDAYVSSMKYGAKEVRDSGIDINGEPESELEITLDSPGATIAGVVKNNKGEIVPDAKVALVSQNTNVVVPLSPTTESDQYGAFTFRGVAPGNYAVFAWSSVPNGAWNDPKFLEPFQSRGKKIQAEKGSTANLELQVLTEN